jgi:hypothetical protein
VPRKPAPNPHALPGNSQALLRRMFDAAIVSAAMARAVEEHRPSALPGLAVAR